LFALRPEEKLNLEAKRRLKAQEREEKKNAENLRINNNIAQKEASGQRGGRS
jgi:hypothetical protein